MSLDNGLSSRPVRLLGVGPEEVVVNSGGFGRWDSSWRGFFGLRGGRCLRRRHPKVGGGSLNGSHVDIEGVWGC